MLFGWQGTKEILVGRLASYGCAPSLAPRIGQKKAPAPKAQSPLLYILSNAPTSQRLLDASLCAPRARAQQLLRAPVFLFFFRILLCAYLRVRQFPVATLGCFQSRGTVALCPLRRSTCRTRHGLLSSAPTAQHVVDASRKEQFSVQSRARTRKRGASVSRVSIFRAAHLRRSTCSQRHPRGHCMFFN